MPVLRATVVSILSLSIAAALTGCKPPPQPTPAELQAERRPTEELVQRTDTGDIEATVFIEAELDPNNTPEGVRGEETRTPNKKLLQYTITVPDPAPETLPVRFVVVEKKKYTDVYVAVRVSVVVEGQGPIETFSGVLGRRGPQDEYARTVDLFKNNPPLGERVLVYANYEAVLLPTDVELDAVDAGTVTADEDDMTTMMGVVVSVEQASR